MLLLFLRFISAILRFCVFQIRGRGGRGEGGGGLGGGRRGGGLGGGCGKGGVGGGGGEIGLITRNSAFYICDSAFLRFPNKRQRR